MTRDDAIYWLKTLAVHSTENDMTQIDKALNMAVESLSQPKQEWIPCEERLPEEDGRYLVRLSDDCLDDYSDFTEIEIVPFEVDCESFGYWVDRFDPISLGFVDCDWNEFPVIAWQPLPEPYQPTGYKMEQVEEPLYTWQDEQEYNDRWQTERSE